MEGTGAGVDWQERLYQQLRAADVTIFSYVPDAGHRVLIDKSIADKDATSIDFGIMEGAERVAMIPVQNLGWNDVGSWTSLFEVLAADKDGNIVQSAEHLNIDSHNSLVHVNGKSER